MPGIHGFDLDNKHHFTSARLGKVNVSNGGLLEIVNQMLVKVGSEGLASDQAGLTGGNLAEKTVVQRILATGHALDLDERAIGLDAHITRELSELPLFVAHVWHHVSFDDVFGVCRNHEVHGFGPNHRNTFAAKSAR